jgi:hypothetical protein
MQLFSDFRRKLWGQEMTSSAQKERKLGATICSQMLEVIFTHFQFKSHDERIV